MSKIVIYLVQAYQMISQIIIIKNKKMEFRYLSHKKTKPLQKFQLKSILKKVIFRDQKKVMKINYIMYKQAEKDQEVLIFLLKIKKLTILINNYINFNNKHKIKLSRKYTLINHYKFLIKMKMKILFHFHFSDFAVNFTLYKKFSTKKIYNFIIIYDIIILLLFMRYFMINYSNNVLIYDVLMTITLVIF